jgi:hypothetical protein
VFALPGDGDDRMASGADLGRGGPPQEFRSARFSDTSHLPITALRTSSRGAVRARGAELFFALGVFRSFGNGARERLDQLGNGREDRAFIGSKRNVRISSSQRLIVFSGIRLAPFLMR